ncbi:MAG TPA: hypothetical protein VFV87_14760 [Pirellulaceae bacterium]|nr:hypothetical protein [Pirellulaceae bacterium]
MAHETRTLHKLSPKFIIPVGTQVVLKAPKTLPGGEYRKPGTVGVVVESPPHNEEPYVVQFADGSEAKARFPLVAGNISKGRVSSGLDSDWRRVDCRYHVRDVLTPRIVAKVSAGSGNSESRFAFITLGPKNVQSYQSR